MCEPARVGRKSGNWYPLLAALRVILVEDTTMSTRLMSGFVATMAASLFYLAPALAEQYTEIEPNAPCSSAQIIGLPPSYPSSVVGELEFVAEPPGDVDFFVFEASEGMRLRAGLRGATTGSGTLVDPYLGLFDAACNLIAFNDDFGGLNSRIDFDVPPGGTFILAASGCCDFYFDGNHGQNGTYRLRVFEPPVPIEAITGRIVDAVSGEPLAGNVPPYPNVELALCNQDGCYQGINYLQPDEFGVFRFETDWSGNPLDPGQYLIRVWAGEYEPAEVGPFEGVSAEVTDLGDIALQPPPFRFDNVIPCADIPADGGMCKFSVDIRNNTESQVKGLGWGIVNTWGGTSPLGYSMFQADGPKATPVKALSSSTLKLSFYVPAGVAEGTFMCVDGWFSDRDTEYFGTLRGEPLFCVSKQQGIMTVVKPKDAAAMLGIESVSSWKPGRGGDRH